MTTAHTVPFVATAILLGVLSPLTIPVSLILIAHAWVIPELYAARGANVVRARPPAGAPRSTCRSACSATCSATTHASSSARPDSCWSAASSACG